MKTLHWFRYDLRLDDNDAIASSIAQSREMAFVYVWDEQWFAPNAYGYCSMGPHRQRFIQASLDALSGQLEQYGHQLLIVKGKSSQLICHLLQSHAFDALSVCEYHGYNEQNDILEICGCVDNVQLILGRSSYLFAENELPFSLINMPDTFSPFRRKVEKYCQPRKCCEVQLGSIKNLQLNTGELVEAIVKARTEVADVNVNDYAPGADGALLRIHDYFFDTDNISTYKATRNGLDGWDFSSRLSAYLACGCVSPAKVVESLHQYEQQRIKNESTYWLYFELLWREFFHWLHKKHGKAFFEFTGINGFRPNSQFDGNRFRQWVNGQTGYAIVDACMKQLAATGFMSNRGRQLVASCFVHELNLDWRYGAAYFEHMLIDYDVASNWGNWQYLAGVGSDPRGHRQFNLEKQTNTYDPEREFIRRWLD